MKRRAERAPMRSMLKPKTMWCCSGLMKYPTPELLREMANEPSTDLSEDMREGVREVYLRAADALEARGFYATATMFLITEAKALEVELRRITDAANKDDQVPGWRTFSRARSTSTPTAPTSCP